MMTKICCNKKMDGRTASKGTKCSAIFRARSSIQRDATTFMGAVYILLSVWVTRKPEISILKQICFKGVKLLEFNLILYI